MGLSVTISLYFILQSLRNHCDIFNILGKFKTGIPGVSSNISTNELIELLKARDHNGEYRQVSGHGKIVSIINSE